MEEKKLTCIGCPRGCQLEIKMEQEKILEIVGHSCKRGELYAKKELTNPTRIVTTTVRAQGGNRNVVSVKTKSDIPKGKISQCMKELSGITVQAPVELGEVVLANVAGTGVDVVVTKKLQIKNI